MPLPAGEVLLVIPAAGVAIAALTLPPWARGLRAWATGLGVLASIVPLLALARPGTPRSTGQALWEWSTLGGPIVHAAYHVDALSVVGASIVGLVSVAALRAIADAPVRRVALPSLVVAQAFALIVLGAVEDLVAAVLVAGAVAALTAAVGFLVAAPPAAARLAALLALGVQAFIAMTLLVARFGGSTFDLGDVPSAAIGPDVLAAMALGAALFCGLYPFVPWRYEPPRSAPPGPPGAPAERATQGVDPLATLRGALAFPAGIVGTILALRVVGATDADPASFALPAVDEATRLGAAAVVVAFAGTALLRARLGRASREALAARALAALAVLALIAAYPVLRWSHLVALLALASVAYASLASAAVPEEWAVARLDARLGTLWAAIALGTPLALAGGLFAAVASGVALAIEAAPLPAVAANSARASARALAVIGPLVALGGVLGVADASLALLAGAALAWAAAVEAGHAIREARAETAPLRARGLHALVAYAVAVSVGLASAIPVAEAARLVLPAVPPTPEALVPALLALFALPPVFLAAGPEIARLPLPSLPLAPVRAALAAADPVPGALLTYRSVEALSSRIATGFAFVEERAGVWLATLLLALTLVWAATS